jgi:hypothetical protein
MGAFFELFVILCGYTNLKTLPCRLLKRLALAFSPAMLLSIVIPDSYFRGRFTSFA